MNALIDALRATIVGQEDAVESLVLGLLANGHVLLEGPPGLAKTLACRTLASSISGVFKRVQFTPDLLPADIVGTRVFDQRDAAFRTVLGPVFANVLLADEINRAPAKVQSALLEAMQERQVTIGLETHPLPDPFIVLATMNPLDSEGTYALPYAQMDRFLLKVNVSYPTAAQERQILERFGMGDARATLPVASTEDVVAWRERAARVHLDEKLKAYIVELVTATREPASHVPEAAPYIDAGASPRATLALAYVSRAKALLEGRDFTLPDDVRAVAPAVLRHRLSFSYRTITDNVDREDVLRRIINAVKAP